MKITLRIEEDADLSTCPWPKVDKVVRQWATSHGSSLPLDFFLPLQRNMSVELDVQTDDLITAVRRLHDELYDLQVNFTVSVD
ncbi:MAG: hypothetical protein KKA54_12625 [Proteobacteria bacterium]|nr:hypothetical protein [Pseudomonadota bacterium]MBU0967210.1 hypothetical protein [Pseudomonadota bacterium]